MSVVIAARFDTFAAANSAAHALFAMGVPAQAVSVFFVSDPKPTVTTATLDDDPRSLTARFYARAHVAGLAMLGALLGAGLVLGLGGAALVMAMLAALGAFLGSWVGATWLATRTRAQAEIRQHRHALLTADVPRDQEGDVIQVLLDAGSDDVARARGQWVHGQWVEGEPKAVGRIRPRHASANGFGHRGEQPG